jgi:hypothetical protein
MSPGLIIELKKMEVKKGGRKVIEEAGSCGRYLAPNGSG